MQLHTPVRALKASKYFAANLSSLYQYTECRQTGQVRHQSDCEHFWTGVAHFDVTTSNVSFLRGPTQRKVTSQRDRYLTSHTPEPHGRTSSRGFIGKGPDVVTSIHCYNRHVWSYSVFLSAIDSLFFMHKFFILIHLLHSCTCFEHYCSHLQENKLY